MIKPSHSPSFFLFLIMFFIFSGNTHAAGDCSSYIGQATLNEFFKDQANQSNDVDDFAEVKILNGSIPLSEYGTWKIEICEKSIAANNNDEDGCSGGILLSSFTDTSTPWLVLKGTTIGQHINLKTGFDATLVDGNGDLIDYISVDGYSDAISGFSCNLSNLIFDYTAGSPGASDKTIFRSPDGTGDWDSAPSATAPPTEDTTNDDLPPPPSGETYPFVTINNISVDIGGTAIFTVSLVDNNGDPATFSQAVTISYYTQDGTATVADGDYSEVPLTATPATVTIAAGQASTSISISSPSSNYADIGEIFYAVLNAVENSADNGGSPNAIITKHFGEATLDASGCSFSTTGIIGGTEIDVKDDDITFNNGTTSTLLNEGTTTDENSVILDGSIINQPITLPDLPAITFETVSTLTLSDGDTLTPALNYGLITVERNSTITLTAGTYNINQFIFAGGVTINVTGPVIINTNEFIYDDDGINPKIDGQATINDGGDPANLTINIYGGEGAEFDLGNDSKFTGIVYSSFSNTKFEIDDQNTFTGGLFTAGEVKLKKTSLITYNDAARAAAFSVLGCIPIRTLPTVNSQVTPNPTPTITGTYDSSDAAGGFTVSVAGTTYTLGTSPELTATGDDWTLVIAVPITTGIYDVVASSTNGFGNVITDTTTDELTIGTGSCFSDSYPIFAGKDLDIKDNNISFTYNGTTTTLTEDDTPSSAINTSGVTSSQTPALPTLPAITFVTAPDVSLSDGDTLAPGDYGVVSVANNATITLSAGTYNVDQFLISKGATINVSGPVIINTNEFVYTAGGSGNINVNTGGNPANFIINLYDGQNAEFDLGDDSSFTGIIYSSFSDTKIEIDDDNTFIGAIISNGDVDLKDGSSLTFTPEAKTAVASVIGCSVNDIDHFAINYTFGSLGTGVNCQAEKITIEAHDDSHAVFTTHTGAVTLSTSTSNGDWSKTTTTTDANGTLTPGAADSGSASYNFVTSDNGSIILNFKDTNVETISLNTVDGAISETSGSAVANDGYQIVFATSGFNFLADSVKNTITTQISAKPSNVAPNIQSLELQAIKTSDDTGACEAAFQSSTAVEIAIECINPINCSGDNLYISTDGGTTFDQIDNTPELTYINISDFDFGDATDTTAPLIIRYDDSGKIKLHARKTLTPSTVDMIGSSNEFVVRPFGFSIDSAGQRAADYLDDANLNDSTGTNFSYALNASGSIFKKAGENFTLSLTAVQWQTIDDANNDGIPDTGANLTNNATTLNFGNEITPVIPSNVLSVPTVSLVTYPGTLTNSANDANFTNGAGNKTYNWSEVGIFNLTTTLSNYLASGENIVGSAQNIGRFVPDHFDTTLIHGCTGGATFTYSGQGFSVSATAKNIADGTTQNYQGNFAFITTLSDANSSPLFNFNNNTIATFNDGIGNRSDVQITFIDKDTVATNVTLRARDVDTATAIGDFEDITEIRSGRTRLENSFGSELIDMTVPATVEYYTANGFIINAADTCSAVTAVLTDLDLTAGTVSLGDGSTTGQTCIWDDDAESGTDNCTALAGPVTSQFEEQPPINGSFNLNLKAPGATFVGDIGISLTSPTWLQYDWDGNGTHDNDPTGVASFGLYRGDDRIIYWREVFQ